MNSFFFSVVGSRTRKSINSKLMKMPSDWNRKTRNCFNKIKVFQCMSSINFLKWIFLLPMFTWNHGKWEQNPEMSNANKINEIVEISCLRHCSLFVHRSSKLHYVFCSFIHVSTVPSLTCPFVFSFYHSLCLRKH